LIDIRKQIQSPEKPSVQKSRKTKKSKFEKPSPNPKIQLNQSPKPSPKKTQPVSIKSNRLKSKVQRKSNPWENDEV